MPLSPAVETPITFQSFLALLDARGGEARLELIEGQGCSTLWSERGAGGAVKEIFSLSEGDLV